MKAPNTPPTKGAITGTQNQPLQVVKTGDPYPTKKLTILGPKSLAGLRAPPQLYPNDNSIPNNNKPIAKGVLSFLTGAFLSSVIANIPNKKIPVPTT